MQVAQILLSDAGEYERKSQRIDLLALSSGHQVSVTTVDRRAVPPDLRIRSGIAHVYGAAPPPALSRALEVPWVASTPVPASRISWFRTARQPSAVAGPTGVLPEAVEERFFEGSEADARRMAREQNVKIVVRRIGTYGAHRPGVSVLIEQTLARIHRFRDDVTWSVMDHPPAPADIAGVDVWVDPGASEDDCDGFVAEALVVGTPVVAVRTAINTHRLEKGRTGFLVPPGDPNEMTHAILTALFKPEVAEQKNSLARQTVSKFRPRRRARALADLYGTLTA